MAKVNYSLSSKKDKALNKSEVLIRFIYGNGKAIRAKSGIYVTPERWDIQKSKVIIPRIRDAQQKDLANVQERLDRLRNHILNEFISLDDTSFNPAWLKELIDKFNHPEKYNVVKDKPTFFEVFTEFLEKHKLSEVRKRNFMVLFRALKRFELYKGIRLDLDSISLETLQDLENFFKIEHSFFKKEGNEYICSAEYTFIYNSFTEARIPQPRGQNTINGLFTKLRTFILWAIDAGYTINNPFKKFVVEECTYGTPYYITIEERNSLAETDLSHRPGLAIQRDIFVFQCLIGCRVGDLYKMTKSNIIRDAIEYIPRKTKEGRPVTVRVPLNSQATAILEKYKDFDGYGILPFISQQKYNIAIKEAFKLAGLTRIVTVLNPLTREAEQRPLNEVASSHLARRCFVGNLYKKVKDPNLVGALSGHKEGSKAFARYREIDEDMKRELTKMLE